MKNTYLEILENQLAIDYDCTVEEVESVDNIYRAMKRNNGARRMGSEESMLKIAVYKEKLLVMADEKILNWCKQTFQNERGTWFSEPVNLYRINKKLEEYGQSLVDAHHHYIPAKDFAKTKERFSVKWYSQEEIFAFKGDGRFGEALLFDEEIPDMLAVCAVENNAILGMASATRDSEKMWQIGVNVTEEGRGKGIGAYVTALLKEKLLEMGILPFYATVESHIKSQRVAIKSGFEPIFYEIFSEERQG